MRTSNCTSLALSVLTLLSLSACKQKRSETSIPTDTTSHQDTTRSWYKEAVIYTLDVEVFQDSDGDGVGDFKGLVSRLDYIDSLGADVIWLSPFHPTPNKDDGYDVSNFYDVDKRLGTLQDFTDFMNASHARDIKVIMDLVVNHTSTQHPWFKDARSGTKSKYRDWYLWSDTRPENYNTGMIFPGVQESTWTMDSVSHEYYYHRFYDFQPDLNVQNPLVKQEIKKIITFWLGKGINGFRVDAVPFVIEISKTKGEEFDHEFDFLTKIRALVDSINHDAIILGEANVTPDENKDYFGEQGEGINMMFNFYVNQHLFYALATGDIKPLEEALEKTSDIPHNSEWGQFLRNHDEVDLGRLKDKQREKVYQAMGPEKHMQLYDRGIRRRLAPMLNNDLKKLELAYSTMLSLPSTPVLRYGDELGMGDDLRLKERLSVRTPMQWTAGSQAGFTTGKKAVLPLIDFGAFDYRKINVSNEQGDDASLLNWTRKMVHIRKDCPEIAYGEWKIIDTKSDGVLAILYTWNGKQLLVVHNLSIEQKSITVKLDGEKGKIKSMITTKELAQDDAGELSLSLKSYGYDWIKLE